jgi:hypothetical protein
VNTVPNLTNDIFFYKIEQSVKCLLQFLNLYDLILDPTIVHLAIRLRGHLVPVAREALHQDEVLRLQPVRHECRRRLQEGRSKDQSQMRPRGNFYLGPLNLN